MQIHASVPVAAQGVLVHHACKVRVRLELLPHILGGGLASLPAPISSEPPVHPFAWQQLFQGESAVLVPYMGLKPIVWAVDSW
jgi:hypothetical protein